MPADLATAVLPVMDWRLSELPKSLPAEEVETILSSCDRTTVAGRRDYAILLQLARLGLRACDAAALTLDDFDWNEAVVWSAGGGCRRSGSARCRKPQNHYTALCGEALQLLLEPV